jgi:hypothetical protein
MTVIELISLSCDPFSYPYPFPSPSFYPLKLSFISISRGIHNNCSSFTTKWRSEMHPKDWFISSSLFLSSIMILSIRYFIYKHSKAGRVRATSKYIIASISDSNKI